MTSRSLARVLIIDNDSQVRSDLREILEPLGYRVQIAQGVGRDLIDQALVMARDFRPHVAIVDLRLLDEYSDDRSGLGLLKGLQSASCVLYSAYLTPELTLEVFREYGTTRWVSKHQSPQQLLDEVADAANESFRQDLALDRPSALTSERIVEILFGPNAGVPQDVVETTFGQLFPKNKKIWLQKLGGEIETPLSVSRGHSFVSKAYPDDLEPVVVKLAPTSQARNEEQNYRGHVEGRLVGQFYAHLERVVEFWDLGGAVYSFLGSSLSSLPSFAAYFRGQKDSQAILRPLVHFFTEVWSRHYERPLSEGHLSLFRVYDKALHLTERLKSFSHQEEKLALPDLPESITNPVHWVRQHTAESQLPKVRMAITHGDLHGDNLFVDGERAWAIDFERTGPGHILRDFVELEIDILTRLAPLPGLSEFYELAMVLTETSDPSTPFQPTAQAMAKPETLNILEVISGLRRLAYETASIQDFREYFWGLLLDSVFVATLVSEDSPQRERALILGGVLCDRIQG